MNVRWATFSFLIILLIDYQFILLILEKGLLSENVEIEILFLVTLISIFLELPTLAFGMEFVSSILRSEIYLKNKFIINMKRELNANNSFYVKGFEKIEYKIKNRVHYLLYLFVGFFSVYIMVGYYTFQNLPDGILYKFTDLDNASARYFFSTVSQSLSALFAISFTIFLIYMQISVDKYSLQTVRHIFQDPRGVLVVCAFLVTILYSTWFLANIRGPDICIYEGPGVALILIMMGFCAFILVVFFFRTFLNLIPENFALDSKNRILMVLRISLNKIQDNWIRSEYLITRLQETEIIVSPLDKGDSPVYLNARGIISDIKFTPLEKANELLKEETVEGGRNSLYLTRFIGNRLGGKKSVVAYVSHPDDTIRNEIVELVQSAYNIDHNQIELLNYYREIDPLTVITIKAIKDNEKGVYDCTINEFFDLARESLLIISNFDKIPSGDD